MAQRLQACTPCHAREGVATADGYFPRIAGKPEAYLFEQLLNCCPAAAPMRPLCHHQATRTQVRGPLMTWWPISRPATRDRVQPWA